MVSVMQASKEVLEMSLAREQEQNASLKELDVNHYRLEMSTVCPHQRL